MDIKLLIRSVVVFYPYDLFTVTPVMLCDWRDHQI